MIAPDVGAGIPTYTNQNITYLDYRTGTAANPEANLQFPFGPISYNIYDASPNSTNSKTQAESYALPVVNVTVNATGTGVPVPGYFYVFNRSPGANNAMGASNSVGLIAGCESNGNSPYNDAHSGCWGANFLAVSDGTNTSDDQSIFGIETNIFIERKDPGRFSATPNSQPKFGIVSSNSGTYRSQAGFLSSQSNGDTNSPYDAFLCDKAYYDCFIAGTPGSINNVTYGFRASATGVATSGGNLQSLPYAWFGSTWSGSAAQDDVWQAADEPTVSGSNPVTYWTLRHSINGVSRANEFSVSSIGNVAAAGAFYGAGFNTTFNCVSNSSCGAAPTGMAAIAASSTTVVVSTTAVTANSEIRIQYDETLGGASQLNVTCNTSSASEGAAYWVSARTPGTSLTIKTNIAPTSHAACLSWTINN
jgi:hypothetical protein